MAGISTTSVYRESPGTTLSTLPRPKRPRAEMYITPSELDLDAGSLLPAAFQRAGASVEETSRDGIVLSATVVGAADDLFLGWWTAYPRTRGILRASIPESIPPVVVVPRRHSGIWGWAAWGGLVAEYFMEDPVARDTFFVRGDPQRARAFLTPELCAAIVALGPMFWRLSIGKGVVDLCWRAPRFDPEIALPKPVVDLVVAIAKGSAF
jgi:hypothetical protein